MTLCLAGHRWRLALVLLTAACSRDLAAPDRLGVAPLAVDGISLEHAFAGARVTVTGRGFGSIVEAIDIRVGDSVPVRPSKITSDTSLDVVGPDDATDGAISISLGGQVASAAKTFHFVGLGHLRHGQVVRQMELSIQQT